MYRKQENVKTITGKNVRREDFKKNESYDDIRKARSKKHIHLRKKKKKEKNRKRRNIIIEKIDRDNMNVILKKCFNAFERKEELENEGKDIFQPLNVVRKYTAQEENPPLDEIVDMGFVPHLLKFFAHKNEKIVLEACWTITNICSGSKRMVEEVIKHKGIGYLMECVRVHKNDEIRSQAIWALGNIAGEGIQYRDLLLKTKYKAPLYEVVANFTKYLMDNNKPKFLEDAMMTISNLFRGPPAADVSIVKKCIKHVLYLMTCPVMEVVSDAMWTLYHMIDGTNEHIQILIDFRFNETSHGVDFILKKCLTHKEIKIRKVALGVIGNLTSGTDEQTGYLISRGLLPSLRPFLLTSEKTDDHIDMRKDSIWIISNIAAVKRQGVIQKLINTGIYKGLYNLLKDLKFSTRVEVAFVFSNSTFYSSDNEIKGLLMNKVVEVLCNFLKNSDLKTILLSIEGLYNLAKRENFRKLVSILIEKCGGRETIEKLIYHDEIKVREPADTLMKAIKGEEHESETQVESNPFSFMQQDKFVEKTKKNENDNNFDLDEDFNDLPGLELDFNIPQQNDFDEVEKDFDVKFDDDDDNEEEEW